MGKVADGIKVSRGYTLGEVFSLIGHSDLNPASPYEEGWGYCPTCGLYYWVDEAPKGRFGRPVCPRHRRFLRRKSRGMSRRRGADILPEVVLDE